jgi:stearoyl-CoA desaturase (delta-9 desaturase)
MPDTALAPSVSRRPHGRPRFSGVFGFAFIHVAAVVGVAVLDFSWKGIALCLASYYLRMFAITAGFHRYFAHRAYKLGRVPQFLLALLAQTSAQKGVLWWAAHHRHHHKYSDTPRDLHSPVVDGFWWSHIGWILCRDNEQTDLSKIPDFAKYPELRWLNANQYAATILYALGMYLAFGWTGLVWGYFLSTVLLWHGTFSINSVMHLFGRRVFPTSDESRNSMILALVTMGEGWHNNHHYYPSSAAQGFLWWQVDASYYLLWLLERIGLVKDLRRAPSVATTAVLETVRGTKSRLETAFSSASGSLDSMGEQMGHRIEQLSKRWEEKRGALRDSAHQALADLEEARQHAARRLETLQADYAAKMESLARTTRSTRARAGAAAHESLEELRAEIEKARAHLAEILARLVEAAEGLALPDGSPA